VQVPAPLTPHLGYLAGPDEERLAQVHWAFTQKELKAVFCARGGYGSMRLISGLRAEILTQNPKIFVGYSDLTTFLNLLTNRFSMVTFHGPVVAKDLDRQARPRTLEFLQRVLMEEKPLGLLDVRSWGGRPPVCLHSGKARGILIGGNLSLIAATLGTECEIQTDGKILFLEEVNEPPYRVDRLFAQLKLAKKLSRVAGILLGEFVGCQATQPTPTGPPDIVEVLRDILRDIDVPILYGFPAGHTLEKLTLPLGVQVLLDADQGTLEVTEAGVV
jgi:muramoyltetrapeptide carboxypeptidase